MTDAELLWGLAMFFSLIIGGTLIQFAAMRAFGAWPNYKFGWRSKSVLGSEWIAEGYRFSRRQFAVVGSIRFLFGVVVGALYVALIPTMEPGMFVLVVYLVAEVRASWSSSTLTLRQPQETLFEEREEGTRLYLPQQGT